MKVFLSYSFFAVLLLPPCLPAIQDAGEDSVRAQYKIEVRKIILAGNDITDEDVILREVKTRENSVLDESVLKEDIQRLNRLGLFNKIDVYPVPTDSVGQIDIMFVFEESFYFIPLPQGGFRNGQFSQFWAGLNLIWRNFRGRNETLNASFGIGADPFVGGSYTVPWIGTENRYFSSLSAGYSKNRNKSLETIGQTGNEIPDKDENYYLYNFKSSFSVGRFFSNALSFTGTIRYNSLVTSQYEPGRTVSPDGKDKFINITFGSRYDTRNAYDLTTVGTFVGLDYTKEGFGKLIDLNKIDIDARQFIPVKLGKDYSLTIAASVTSTVAFGGSVPSYMREFFGYEKVIRGHKKLVYEGDNRLGFFNEIRFPLLKERYFSGGGIPGVNLISALKKMSYRFAVYGTLFFDVGTVWNKSDLFINSRYYNGFGAGLNFILPFGLVGRTDFAFRTEGKRFIPQLIVDLNAAF